MNTILNRISLFLLCLLSAAYVRADNWYPLEVDVWEPPFNTERQRVQKEYVPLDKAALQPPHPWTAQY